MARLAGRRCIVTGAARGIGREIAGTFHAHGATVGLLDMDTSVKEAAAELDGVAAVADVRDTPALAAAVGHLIGELGGVDVLVNNAGILRITPLLDITVDEWDLVMDVNARSMLVATQVAARAMIAAAPDRASGAIIGKVINMASMGAKRGGANQAHYAASKAAVVSLTQVAAPTASPSTPSVRATCSPIWVPPRAPRRWWRRGVRRRRSVVAPRRRTWPRWPCSWRRATATTAPARR
jgi:NAD(P)-dependent dehydrogenase (short-subunit alcohol dehydrogenase family)